MCSQAAQLTYIMNERLKKAAEDVDWERALRDVVVATTNDKGKATAVAKKRPADVRKARALAE